MESAALSMAAGPGRDASVSRLCLVHVLRLLLPVTPLRWTVMSDM